MSLTEGMRAYLVAHASVIAVFSDRVAATQVHSSVAMPYCLLQSISDMHRYHAGGKSGVASARMQVDAVAGSPAGALAGAAAIDTALSGYRGLMGTVSVRRCHRANRVGPDLFGPTDGSQVGKYRVRSDYLIDYHE